MTEPPPGAAAPRGGTPEHPVDAAARGAHPGPPVPQRPTRRQVWGWRAALLIPAAIGSGGFVGFLTAPGGVGRDVVAAVAGTTLLVFLGLGWWSAAQPRLSDTDAARVHSALGRAGTRRLQRALRRGDDVPAELRAWALPYLAQRPWPPPAAGWAMSAAPANLLLTTRDATPNGVDVVLTALVGALLPMVLAGVVVSRRMHRHAHRLLHNNSGAAPDAAGRG